MHIKWVIGKKTHYALAAMWTAFAVFNFTQGHWFIGGLELIIALHDLRDAQSGLEVTAFELETRKGVK